MADRKLLCVADGSPEARAAVLFAARRAALTGADLVILRAVEPMEAGLWATMGGPMRDEITADAVLEVQELARVAVPVLGREPQMVVREGDAEPEIRAVIDNDPAIKTLVLAAAPGRSGPGPLVTAAARGGLQGGARAVVVMIVPGGLSDSEVLTLGS
jgi:nucleotide-binding universal stress UspA family protein